MKSYLGKQYGKLTIIDIIDKDKFLCQCECSNIKSILKTNVLSGKSKSCGCMIGISAKKRFTHDLTGKRFGKLVVLHKDENSLDKLKWVCQCDCGNIVSIVPSSLVSGDSTSCGCYKKENTSNLLSHHLEGQKFGKLTVLERIGTDIGSDGTKYSLWKCRCDCGVIKNIRGTSLISGKTKSCGCIQSYGELTIKELLENNNVKFTTQYTFQNLVSKNNKRLKFDFALLDDKDNLICLIEYNGIQHYKENKYNINFVKTQREETDILKQQYCKNKNIPLYIIKYNDNIEIEIYKIISTL